MGIDHTRAILAEGGRVEQNYNLSHGVAKYLTRICTMVLDSYHHGFLKARGSICGAKDYRGSLRILGQ